MNKSLERLDIGNMHEEKQGNVKIDKSKSEKVRKIDTNRLKMMMMIFGEMKKC